MTADRVSNPFRLAVVTSHPVQYQAPLFQHLAGNSEIDLTVYYGHDGSLVGELDDGFGVRVTWDRPLTSGYRSVFLTRRHERKRWDFKCSGLRRLVVDFRRQRYDAVLIHSYATAQSAMGYLAAYLSGTPVLLRTESELLRARGAWRNQLRRLYMRLIVRFTAGFLVIGTANRAFYRSFEIPEARLFDTPYAVDTDFFDRARVDLQSHRQHIRDELGFPAGVTVVVFSGKLIARKRPLDVVEAISRLTREGLKVGLLMIGEGELRVDIEQSIQHQSLPFVHLAGFVNQTGLPRYYLAGDVFVLPAQFDTWGLVVNEAMLFSMPAIVTDMVGAGQDLVEPGITGQIYPAGEVTALTSHLREVLLDPERRVLMGAAARVKALGYNFEADQNGIMSALRSVARQPSQDAR